jgi:hypothetical protein
MSSDEGNYVSDSAPETIACDDPVCPVDLSATVEEAKKRLILEIDHEMNKHVSLKEKGKSELTEEEERRLSIESTKLVLKKVDDRVSGDSMGVSVFHLVPAEKSESSDEALQEHDNGGHGERDEEVSQTDQGEDDAMDVADQGGDDFPTRVFEILISDIENFHFETEVLFTLRQVSQTSKLAITPLLALIGVNICRRVLSELKDEVDQFLPRRLTKYQSEKVQRFYHRLKHFENELDISKSRMHQYLEIQRDIDQMNVGRNDPIRSIYCLYDQEYSAVSSIRRAVMDENDNLDSFFQDIVEGIPTERHGSISREGYDRFTEAPSPHFPQRHDTSFLADLNRFRSHQANRGLPQDTLLSRGIPEPNQFPRAVATSPPTHARLPETLWLGDEGSPVHPHMSINLRKHPLGGSGGQEEALGRQVGYDSPFEMDDYIE